MLMANTQEWQGNNSSEFQTQQRSFFFKGERDIKEEGKGNNRREIKEEGNRNM